MKPGEFKITTCGNQVIILFHPSCLIKCNGIFPPWHDRMKIEKLTESIIEWDDEKIFTCITESIGAPCYLIAFDVIKSNYRYEDQQYTEDELIEISTTITTGPKGIA